jgi:hypothetical protein
MELEIVLGISTPIVILTCLVFMVRKGRDKGT